MTPFDPETSPDSSPDSEDGPSTQSVEAASLQEDKRPAAEQIEAAVESLSERLASINDRAEEKLANEETIEVNDREWQIDEIPDAYLSPAFAQKRYELLKETVEEIRKENEVAAAGSDEEAEKYFELQMAVPLVDLAEITEEQEQLKTMLQQHHPGLHETVFDYDLQELQQRIAQRRNHE